MKKIKYKVKYTNFEKTKYIDNYLTSLSYIAKLNMLLEKDLITKSEYEKVKCAIGYIAHF